MTSNIKELDPVQGLIDYIEDIKPYHTKIIEVLTEYVYFELIDTTITEKFESTMDLIYPGPETQVVTLATLGGFGGVTPWDGFTSWPVIPENTSLALGPFADTPAGYDLVADTVKIPGDRTNQYVIGQDIIIDLYAVNPSTGARTVGDQTVYALVGSEFFTFGQVNGIANTQYTLLSVAGLLDPSVALPALVSYLTQGTEASYDNVLPNGTFVGGDGAGGTAYAPLDTITLSDGSILTVNAIDGDGDVTEFSITSISGTSVTPGVALTQSGSSGTGIGFTLTPESANIEQEVYAAGVNLSPFPIDSVVGYSNASPVFYTDVPPGPDPLPTPTVGSLSQTPDENPGALVFSNSFVLLGDEADAFPQGFTFEVIGGTTEGIYVVKYAYYDSIGDKTYIRVVQDIDTAGFVAGTINEQFFGYDVSTIDETEIPIGLTSTRMLEKLVFSWSMPAESDVIDGYQFLIQETDAGTDFITVSGDATADISVGDDIAIVGSTYNDGMFVVDTPAPAFNGASTDIYVTTAISTTTTGTAKYSLRIDQSEQDYDGNDDNGTYVGGDGVGGTAYAALDTITLSDGTIVTVNAVDGDGDVTDFGITTPSTADVTLGVVLTQSVSSGAGLAFTLTPQLANVFVKGRGWVEKYTP